MSIDVVGIGQPSMNYVVSIDRLPKTDEGIRMHAQSWQSGQNVPTAMMAVARLGGSAGLIGITGDDANGRFCVNELKRNNVDVSHIEMNPACTTGSCIALAEGDTGGRSFISNVRTGPERELNDEDRKYIAQAKFLHVGDLSEPSFSAVKCAHENGVKVSIDAAGYNETTMANIGMIDAFVASAFCYRGLFDNENYEENCKKIRDMGPEIVVFTLGSKGCVGLDKNGFFKMGIFGDVKVVDSTGAGDVFHGAFIYGLLQGWSAEESARFASAVSTIKCTRLGGSAGIPTRDVVDKYMATGEIDYSEIDERVKYYATHMPQ